MDSTRSQLDEFQDIYDSNTNPVNPNLTRNNRLDGLSNGLFGPLKSKPKETTSSIVESRGGSNTINHSSTRLANDTHSALDSQIYELIRTNPKHSYHRPANRPTSNVAAMRQVLDTFEDIVFDQISAAESTLAATSRRPAESVDSRATKRTSRSTAKRTASPWDRAYS